MPIASRITTISSLFVTWPFSTRYTGDVFFLLLAPMK